VSRWDVIRQAPGVVHVIPPADLVEHEFTDDCVCGPAGEHVPNTDGPDGWLVVHQALDGRP